MNIEGQIDIVLRTDNKRVDQVKLQSSRPVHASRMFHGKTLDIVQDTLPLLFSVCGTAQACAGARACEQAMGKQASTLVNSVRDQLVEMETIREHLWHILLNWPEFLGDKPKNKGMSKIVALQKAYQQAMTGGINVFTRADKFSPENINLKTLTDVRLSVEIQLQQRVFDQPLRNWLAIDSCADLTEWAKSKQTVAARLIHQIISKNWCSTGRSKIDRLPALPAKQLHALLQSEQFISQPQWQNNCYETSCYTRVDSPLVEQLRKQYGNSILTRLVARLTEIAQLCLRLDSPLIGHNLTEPNSKKAKQRNPGIGQAVAARGQLLHLVQLENDKVRLYQIVAPTEWNFHPQGVVANSLATLVGDASEIYQQAKLIINAIDPCVAYHLSVD